MVHAVIQIFISDSMVHAYLWRCRHVPQVPNVGLQVVPGRSKSPSCQPAHAAATSASQSRSPAAGNLWAGCLSIRRRGAPAPQTAAAACNAKQKQPFIHTKLYGSMENPSLWQSFVVSGKSSRGACSACQQGSSCRNGMLMLYREHHAS